MIPSEDFTDMTLVREDTDEHDDTDDTDDPDDPGGHGDPDDPSDRDDPNDPVNSMGWLGLGDRIVKEEQELFRGGLIHDVDLAQLNNEEVEDAAPGHHTAEFLPRCLDLFLCLSSHLQLPANFTCRLLCILQDLNQSFH